MKKLYIILLIMLLPGGNWIADAAIITGSVYGTISSHFDYGDYTGFDTGDLFHLFNVTYDNEGTHSSIYDPQNDRTTFYTIDQYPYSLYEFLDDTEFELSPDMQRFLSQNTGDNYDGSITESSAHGPTDTNLTFITRQDYWEFTTFAINTENSSGTFRILINTGGAGLTFTNITTSAVPVPDTLGLLGIGCLCLISAGRIRKW